MIACVFLIIAIVAGVRACKRATARDATSSQLSSSPRTQWTPANFSLVHTSQQCAASTGPLQMPITFQHIQQQEPGTGSFLVEPPPSYPANGYALCHTTPQNGGPISPKGPPPPYPGSP